MGRNKHAGAARRQLTLFDLGTPARAKAKRVKQQHPATDLLRCLRVIYRDVPRADLENEEYELVTVSRTAMLALANRLGLKG